ncbi:MAG TPA: hypothetical protein DCP28_17610 [Cytophagales bacterium]|nr:hypothetical protein [Cytophagales bacterium]
MKTGHWVNDSSDLEKEADRAGDAVARGQKFAHQSSLGPLGGHEVIQRDIELGMDNMKDSIRTDVLAFRDELEKEVNYARNLISSNQFRHIKANAIHPYMKQFLTVAQEAQTNKVLDSKAMYAAKAGYWIETYATKVKTPESVLSGDFSADTQVTVGATRPDVVIGYKGTDVAWLDITSSGDAGHIKRKNSTIWENGLRTDYGFYTAEVTYPSFGKNWSFLTDDTPPKNLGGYNYENADKMYELREQHEDNIRKDWARSLPYLNLDNNWRVIPKERLGKLARMTWYFAFGEALSAKQLEALCIYTGIPISSYGLDRDTGDGDDANDDNYKPNKDDYGSSDDDDDISIASEPAPVSVAVTEFEPTSASGKSLIGSKNPQRLRQARRRVMKHQAIVKEIVEDWDEAEDLDDIDNLKEEGSFSSAGGYASFSNKVSAVNAADLNLSKADSVYKRSFAVDTYLVDRASAAATLALYKKNNPAALERNIDLTSDDFQVLGNIDVAQANTKVQIINHKEVEINHKEFLTRTALLLSYLSRSIPNPPPDPAYVQETIPHATASHPLKTYSARNRTAPIATHDLSSDEIFTTKESVKEQQEYTVLHSNKAQKRYAKTTDLIEYLKPMDVPFGGIKVVVKNPQPIPVDKDGWKVTGYMSKKDGGTSPLNLSFKNQRINALQPIDATNALTIIDAMGSGYLWVKTEDIIKHISVLPTAYAGLKVKRTDLKKLPSSTTGQTLKVFPDAQAPNTDAKAVNLQNEELYVYGEVNDQHSVYFPVKDKDDQWWYTETKKLVEYLQGKPSSLDSPRFKKSTLKNISKNESNPESLKLQDQWGKAVGGSIDLTKVTIKIVGGINLDKGTAIIESTKGRHFVKVKDLLSFPLMNQVNLNDLHIVVTHPAQVPKQTYADNRHRIKSYTDFRKGSPVDLDLSSDDIYLPFGLHPKLGSNAIFWNNKYRWVETPDLVHYLYGDVTPGHNIGIHFQEMVEVPKVAGKTEVNISAKKSGMNPTRVDVASKNLKLLFPKVFAKNTWTRVQDEEHLKWANTGDLIRYLEAVAPHPGITIERREKNNKRNLKLDVDDTPSTSFARVSGGGRAVTTTDEPTWDKVRNHILAGPFRKSDLDFLKGEYFTELGTTNAVVENLRQRLQKYLSTSYYDFLMDYLRDVE